MPSLDAGALKLAFGARPDIVRRIQEAADTPQRVALFNDIATYVCGSSPPNPDEPASKRRRVDIASSQVAVDSSQGLSSYDAASAETVELEIGDISVTVKGRKKYNLCLTKNFLYARAANTSAPVEGLVYAWRDFEYVFYLPVPDKKEEQGNFVLFPRGTFLPTKNTPKANASSNGAAPEPLVITVTNEPTKPGILSGPRAATAESVADSYPSLLQWALSTFLRAAGGLTAARGIVEADPAIFHAARSQAYRPTVKAVYVKAFRGSKDGVLFPLPTGILWGFKKPLLFLPLDRIVAVSYTNVLQRTFNLVVEFEPAATDADGSEQATEEIEFSMLDQADFPLLDEKYVRRYGLADRSMAERRKAKRELAENYSKNGTSAAGEGGGATDVDASNGGASNEDGMTELERATLEAERQLQDEEDELEEDYDPGSDGDSEGEGSSGDDEGGSQDGEEDEGEEEDLEEMEE